MRRRVFVVVLAATWLGVPAAAESPRDPPAPDPSADAIAAIAHDLVSRPERCPWLQPFMPRLAAAQPALAAELTALCTRVVEVSGDARVRVDGVELTSTAGRAWVGPRRLTLTRGERTAEAGLCVAARGPTRVDTTRLAREGDTVADRALAHELEAFRALEAGDRCTAIAELGAAYAEVAAPGYLFNMAQAYAEWPGHCVEARRTFEALLARCEACAEGPAARARLAELAGTCTSTVVVRARAPFALRLGARVIATSSPDPVRADRHRADAVIPSGLHVLAVAPEHGRVVSRAVGLDAGERAELDVELEALGEPFPTRTVAQLGTTGLAALALGASAIFAVAYGGASSDLDALAARGADDPSTPLRAEAEALASRGNGFRTGATVGLAVGLTSAVAAALLWLWPSDDDAPTDAPTDAPGASAP